MRMAELFRPGAFNVDRAAFNTDVAALSFMQREPP